MSLIMAPGSGKTVTALFAIDRLLSAGVANGVLYLADRRVSVEQARQAVSMFPTGTGQTFTDVYPVFGYENIAILDELDVRTRFLCVATPRAVRQRLPSLPPDLVDLVVYEGTDRSGPDFTAIVDYFEATSIRFGRSAGKADTMVFRYSPEQAIAEGVLVNHRSARTRRFADDLPLRTRAGKRVFLLGADSDRHEAVAIASELRLAGFDVLFGETPEEMITNGLREIRSDDTLVVLLSPDSIATLALEDVDASLDRRGAEVLPAVLKPCSVPRSLADRGVVDVTAGVTSLVLALRWADAINVAAMDATEFEHLAADLLTRIGFTLSPPPADGDAGFDYQAVYQDVLGLAVPTSYVVQVKHGSGDRLSVRQLHLLAARGIPRVLVVTNFQLTSLARAMLRKVGDQGADIRVLDGLRVRNLLQDHPDLVSRYFRLSEVAG